ncbi:hypothetical protein X777_05422, partial [Ooceraea biroi]
RGQRNRAAAKSLNRRKTVRPDAAPEIYGSPDNEGDSSASGNSGATPVGLLCPVPAYPMHGVLRVSTAIPREGRGEPRAFNQFNYSLELAHAKAGRARRDRGALRRGER